MSNSQGYKKDVTGRIIYLNADEGWGFINSHDIKFSKVYFHWTGLNTSLHFTSLKVDDTVKFNALLRDKGWKAINIEAANDQERSANGS